jgi:ABC-type antimicrobial peptide transport system permease subunit
VQVAAGIALALALWSLAAPLLRGVLYGLGPWSGAEWALAALAVLAATTLASALPAWRAARVDPARALAPESRLV